VGHEDGIITFVEDLEEIRSILERVDDKIDKIRNKKHPEKISHIRVAVS